MFFKFTYSSVHLYSNKKTAPSSAEVDTGLQRSMLLSNSKAIISLQS